MEMRGQLYTPQPLYPQRMSAWYPINVAGYASQQILILAGIKARFPSYVCHQMSFKTVTSSNDHIQNHISQEYSTLRNSNIAALLHYTTHTPSALESTLENSLWKRLWYCHDTDYVVVVIVHSIKLRTFHRMRVPI
jgi:hypothetical protein